MDASFYFGLVLQISAWMSICGLLRLLSQLAERNQGEILLGLMYWIMGIALFAYGRILTRHKLKEIEVRLSVCESLGALGAARSE